MFFAFVRYSDNEILASYLVVSTLQNLNIAASLRLPVPPIPPWYLLNGFLVVEKRPVFIAHHRPGSMIEIKCISCAILCEAGKVQQYEALAAFERCTVSIETVYSVAITRRFIPDGGYLADSNRKLLSL